MKSYQLSGNFDKGTMVMHLHAASQKGLQHTFAVALSSAETFDKVKGVEGFILPLKAALKTLVTLALQVSSST